MCRLIGVLFVTAAMAVVASSCFGPSSGRQVTLPVGGGKSISFDKGGGNLSYTDEKGQTVTMKTEEGSGGITVQTENEKGTTTITGSESGVVAVGPEGEESAWGAQVDQEAIDKLDLPVFAGAKGISSTVMPTMVTAAFETDAAYEDIVAFYESELGEGWSKTSHSSEGVRSTSWIGEKPTRVITINGATGTDKVTFTLMRELTTE